MHLLHGEEAVSVLERWLLALESEGFLGLGQSLSRSLFSPVNPPEIVDELTRFLITLSVRQRTWLLGRRSTPARRMPAGGRPRSALDNLSRRG